MSVEIKKKAKLGKVGKGNEKVFCKNISPCKDRLEIKIGWSGSFGRQLLKDSHIQTSGAMKLFWVGTLVIIIRVATAAAAAANKEAPNLGPYNLPIKLADNDLFITTDVPGLHYAESYYRIRIIFDRTHWEKYFDIFGGPLSDLWVKTLSFNQDTTESKGIGENYYERILDDITTTRFKMSFANVRESCEDGRLSPSHIPGGFLLEKLKDLQPSMTRKKLEFTFPVESSLVEYYIQNLTSCRIDSKNIHITLKVPVRRQGFIFTVKKVHRIHFRIEHNQVCHLGYDPDVTFILLRNQDKFRMTSHLEYICNPDSLSNTGFILQEQKSLCFLPKRAKPNLGTCLTTILDKRPAIEVDKFCKGFLCTNASESRMRTIHVIAVEETMYITNADNDVKIHCQNGSRAYSEVVQPPEYGTIQITPYCKCQVELGLIKVLDSGKCSGEHLTQNLQVFNVLPTVTVSRDSNSSMEFLIFRNRSGHLELIQDLRKAEPRPSFVMWIVQGYKKYLIQTASYFDETYEGFIIKLLISLVFMNVSIVMRIFYFQRI
ncbi:unnamed protein product [Allacma fusca]|uniref:Uncharacterized protein n=1 Tax=Allacma fusca TaxID=39272 RepID=A0A8J2L2Y2_9HEXA|nr:unnamed protein product [Allacma fusca]